MFDSSNPCGDGCSLQSIQRDKQSHGRRGEGRGRSQHVLLRLHGAIVVPTGRRNDRLNVHMRRSSRRLMCRPLRRRIMTCQSRNIPASLFPHLMFLFDVKGNVIKTYSSIRIYLRHKNDLEKMGTIWSRMMTLWNWTLIVLLKKLAESNNKKILQFLLQLCQRLF
jgi:hypothetical protein